MTAAGAMREVVTVLEPARVQNETGEYGDGWVSLGTRRAERMAAPGRELVVGAQVVARVPTQFRMRWPRAIELTPSMRLVHRGRVFAIVSVVDVDGRRVEALVTCDELVGESWPSP